MFVVALVLCGLGVIDSSAQERKLELEENDRICFVGNTFAERMRHFGYFETLLTSRFPDLNLTFRNLGWSADEVDLRPRPLDFGDIHTHLTNQGADVIFLCYGFNESFKGPEALGEFKEDYQSLIDALLQHKYNGVTPPRLVLVSPIPMEPSVGIVDFTRQNDNIRLYAEAVVNLAKGNGLVYADLYTPVADYFQLNSASPLTFNACHLTEKGYWVVAQMLMEAVGFGLEGLWITVDESDESGPSGVKIEYRPKRVATPPPPSKMDSPFEIFQPTLRAEALAPGDYALRVGDSIVARASSKAWATGIPLPHIPLQNDAEELREAINYKNQLFFDRWRAINGYYIYGGRKEPFGVVSFPPEMSRFEERIREYEALIRELAQPPEPVTFELMRVVE